MIRNRQIFLVFLIFFTFFSVWADEGNVITVREINKKEKKDYKYYLIYSVGIGYGKIWYQYIDGQTDDIVEAAEGKMMGNFTTLSFEGNLSKNFRLGTSAGFSIIQEPFITVNLTGKLLKEFEKLDLYARIEVGPAFGIHIDQKFYGFNAIFAPGINLFFRTRTLGFLFEPAVYSVFSWGGERNNHAVGLILNIAITFGF